MPGVAARLPDRRRARVRARRHRARAPEPRRHARGRASRARCSATSRTSTPCSPTPRTGRTTRGRGEIHDGFLWGRGALDMKSQTAAEAVAAARLARDGWRPARGALKVFSRRRRGDRRRQGRQVAVREPARPRPRRLPAQRGRRHGHAVRRPPPVRRLLRGEGHVPLRRARARHAPATPPCPAIADNALLKLAPALERLGSRRPRYDVTDEPRAFLRALGEDPDDPEGAVERIRDGRAAAGRAVRADARRHRSRRRSSPPARRST